MYGVEYIAEERSRQIQEKGYTGEHDRQHNDGELAAAAVGYAMLGAGLLPHGQPLPPFWPWKGEAWRPEGSDLENLIKAGALIAAEIDRIVEDSLLRAR